MQFNTYNKALAHMTANNMTNTHTVTRINLAGHSGKFYYTLLAVSHGAEFEVAWGPNDSIEM